MTKTLTLDDVLRLALEAVSEMTPGRILSIGTERKCRDAANAIMEFTRARKATQAAYAEEIIKALAQETVVTSAKPDFAELEVRAIAREVPPDWVRATRIGSWQCWFCLAASVNWITISHRTNCVAGRISVVTAQALLARDPPHFNCRKYWEFWGDDGVRYHDSQCGKSFYFDGEAIAAMRSR